MSESRSPIAKGFSFLGESVEELKKVTTPTKQETIQATIVTLIIMAFVSICLFLLDLLFGRIIEALIPGSGI